MLESMGLEMGGLGHICIISYLIYPPGMSKKGGTRPILRRQPKKDHIQPASRESQALILRLPPTESDKVRKDDSSHESRYVVKYKRQASGPLPQKHSTFRVFITCVQFPLVYKQIYMYNYVYTYISIYMSVHLQ